MEFIKVRSRWRPPCPSFGCHTCATAGSLPQKARNDAPWNELCYFVTWPSRQSAHFKSKISVEKKIDEWEHCNLSWSLFTREPKLFFFFFCSLDNGKLFKEKKIFFSVAWGKVNIFSGLFKIMCHVKSIEKVCLYKWLFKMLTVPKIRNKTNTWLCNQELWELGGTSKRSTQKNRTIKSKRIAEERVTSVRS